MLASAAARAAPSAHGSAIQPNGPAKPARLSRPSRRPLAPPVAVVDPASAARWAYEVQEFGLTMMGMGIVTSFASGTALAVRRAAAAYTASGLQAEQLAAAADAADAPIAAAAAPAPAVQQPLQQPAAAAAAAAQAPLELNDLKSELQQAAEAAVAAVKSAAQAERAPAPAPAKAAAAAVPNGEAVRPGMTVEEATKQVKDWIAAWRGDEEAGGEPAEAIPGAGAAAGAPTTRVTEPSLPASAAAVLGALTADAPVAATPVRGEDGPAGGPAAEEPALAAVAAAPAAPAVGPESEASAAEREAEYKARISAVVADSKLGQVADAARAERVAERLQKRAVQVGTDYQAKIESLWKGYESKKAEEAALLEKSQRILESLAEREAAERQQLAEAAAVEAAAVTQQQQQQQQAVQEEGALVSFFARIAAFFQALLRWVQQLFGGRSGSAAGASA